VNNVTEGPHDTIEWITYDPDDLEAASWTDPLNGGTMLEERRRPDSVMLPTGHVLIMGGEHDDTVANPDTAHVTSLTCELFDPDNPDTLTQMASLTDGRMYHSQAMLLADGRVWISGNAGEGGTGSGTTYEIFYPPYLFDGTSLRTDRPVIAAAPDSIQHGQPFLIKTDFDAQTVDEVCLIHPSAITHATDMGQRRVLLEFTAVGQESLVVTGPPDGTFAPPGDYLLFVVQPDPESELGKVPSEGKFVRLKAGSFDWSGTVVLDGDFVVPPDSTLTISPGTIVDVASSDGFHAGADTNRVEIIVKGRREDRCDEQQSELPHRVPRCQCGRWQLVRDPAGDARFRLERLRVPGLQLRSVLRLLQQLRRREERVSQCEHLGLGGRSLDRRQCRAGSPRRVVRRH
jgi:Galactose oxidase-like, Early set domain